MRVTVTAPKSGLVYDGRTVGCERSRILLELAVMGMVTVFFCGSLLA